MIPYDKVYLRKLLLSNKSFLQKVFKSKYADVKKILEKATKSQLNVLIRTIYLIAHEGTKTFSPKIILIFIILTYFHFFSDSNFEQAHQGIVS